MGLMDKPKADFNEQYIWINDFLLYFAFIQKETVSDIASWLLYSSFSKDIISYDLDRHYRTWAGKQKHNFDKNIEMYFEQITFDGYSAYHGYLNYVQDKADGMTENDWSEFYVSEEYYKVVPSSFYLNISELDSLDYIQMLGIDFKKAKNYHYTVYSCDNVNAKLRKKSDRVILLTTLSSMTLEESEKNRNRINNVSERKESDEQQSFISVEKLKKLFEWAASVEPLIGEDKATHQIVIDKQEYDRLTPIEKYTFYMKNIALPLAEKIWRFDKDSNLLMRKQVAKLVVELLSDFDLTIPQVDEWLKQSDSVPKAIIDRCAQHDYGNTKIEKLQREDLVIRIRNQIAPELQLLIKDASKF